MEIKNASKLYGDIRGVVEWLKLGNIALRRVAPFFTRGLTPGVLSLNTLRDSLGFAEGRKGGRETNARVPGEPI